MRSLSGGNHARQCKTKEAAFPRIFPHRPALLTAAPRNLVTGRELFHPAAGLLVAVLLNLCVLQGCGGSGGTVQSTKPADLSISVSPSTANLSPGGTQKFVAKVDGTSDTSVAWSVANGGSSPAASALVNGAGSIDAYGNYVAPANVSAAASVLVTATSMAFPSQSASAEVTINASAIVVSPATADVAAGSQQIFTANTIGLSPASVEWIVNGHPGGGPIWGTISPQGTYTAPAIDPGMAVTISATSTSNGNIVGQATVNVVNPAPPLLTGVTYADALANWEAEVLPVVENDSGLVWDKDTRTWQPSPGWTAPPEGITAEVYYEEQFLRPATRMAIAKQDIPLMEQLALFHLTFLQQRTMTIGAILASAPSSAIIFIDGPANARTFPWYEPCSTQVRIRDDIQADAQYLSTAAQFLRAIAEMPAANRTATLMEFVQQYSGFLVSEQLLRVLYGTTPWSHWQNANIPQPVVAAWTFLAQTGYRPPAPYRYEAAMTDTELWLVADSAEVLGADAAAPELAILDSTTRPQLQQAVQAGVSLMQARCLHTVSPDGADVLSAFAGDLNDYSTLAYAGDTGPDVPVTPNPKDGLSWDISHAYRLPIVFRSLYETRQATGVAFPARNDVVALANTYVHLAYNGNSALPAFTNFLDGWNGWFDVGDVSLPNGYPPYQYCQALQSPSNCLMAGALLGWGQLDSVNPQMAKLTQDLVNLAYDDSPAAVAFKNQYYWFAGPYAASAGMYPWLMIYVIGDSAERLP